MPFMKAVKRVLIASELASYRESVVAMFRISLPDLEVFEADSAGMDREVERLHPDLVICSGVTPFVKERVPNWIELYPDCRPFSTFCLDGEVSTTERVELADLLAVAD